MNLAFLCVLYVFFVVLLPCLSRQSICQAK